MSDCGRRVPPDFVLQEIHRRENQQAVNARDQKDNLRESHLCLPPSLISYGTRGKIISSNRASLSPRFWYTRSRPGPTSIHTKSPGCNACSGCLEDPAEIEAASNATITWEPCMDPGESAIFMD